MAETALELIDVSRLRVGVYVQIDLHDAAHSFPLGGFLIASEAQLAQVRAAGLKRVRYSPLRSEVAPLPEQGVVPTWSALGVPRFDDAPPVTLELAPRKS